MRFNIDDNSKNLSTENTTTVNPLSVKEFVNELNDSVADLLKMKEEMKAKMKAQFDSVVKNFFKVVPKMKAITWVQYSPYFNDGDECIFHVRSVSVLNFVPEYFSRYYEDDISEDNKEKIVVGDYSNFNEELLSAEELEACKAVQNFISENEDLMYDLYDNHVAIRITESGTEVNDYDHD